MRRQARHIPWSQEHENHHLGGGASGSGCWSRPNYPPARQPVIVPRMPPSPLVLARVGGSPPPPRPVQRAIEQTGWETPATPAALYCTAPTLRPLLHWHWEGSVTRTGFYLLFPGSQAAAAVGAVGTRRSLSFPLCCARWGRGRGAFDGKGDVTGCCAVNATRELPPGKGKGKGMDAAAVTTSPLRLRYVYYSDIIQRL